MSDDNDDIHTYKTEEIVFGLLTLMAPPFIKSQIIRILKAQVSIKAGEKAKELLDSTDAVFDRSTMNFLKEVNESLAPDLQGPQDGRAAVEEVERMVDEMVSSGLIDVVLDSNDHSDQTGIQVAMPGCECAKCRCLTGLEALGVEIYRGAAGPAIRAKKDLN